MNRGFMDKAAAGGGRFAQATTRGNPTDSALSSLEKQVFRLHTEIEKYGRLGDQLGTAKDTVTLRASISLHKDEIGRKAKETKEQIAGLSQGRSEMTAKQQEKLKKVVERFAQYLDEFQKALKLTSDREVAAPPIMTTGGALPDMAEGEKEALLLRQQQQQETERLDNMVSYNAAIIEERDTEIQGLTSDIIELGQMFQDVAVLVSEQGEMITTVETNAIVTADRVQAGRQELEKAERSQAAATSKKMCLAVVAGVVVGVIVGALILM